MDRTSLIVLWVVVSVVSLAAIVVRHRLQSGRGWADVVAELAFFVGIWRLSDLAVGTVMANFAIGYAVAALVSGCAVACRRLRKKPRRWFDGTLMLLCIVSVAASVDSVGMSSGALMLAGCVIGAVVGLAVVLFRMYRKKGFGNADMMAGVVYMACAVKFLELAFGMSWLAGAGVAAGLLVTALLAYCALCFVL